MGTRAAVKLQTRQGDALLLYTRYDGFKEDIQKWGSHLTERWTRNVEFVEKWIAGKEQAFPVLTQWCKDTKAFLEQPETLGGAANLISSASLNHLHADFAMDVAVKDEDRAPRIQRQLDEVDFCLTPNFLGESHMRPRSSKRIKPATDEASVISIQYEITGQGRPTVWNEVLYETTRTSAEDVVKDLMVLPRFFREMSLITRDKGIREMTGAEILSDLSEMLGRLMGKSVFDKSPDRDTPITKEKMLRDASGMLPMGAHLSQLGQHLALLKPGDYKPSTAARYLTPPNRLASLKIIEQGSRMTETMVCVAPDCEKGLKGAVAKAIKEEARLRREGELAVLFEGSSPVAIDVKDSGIQVNYVQDVVSVLHTVANVPIRHINDVLERGLLRKRVGELSLRDKKKPCAL